MSSIYRRARPATFDEVIGQEHVTSILTAAIGRDAVGHAYLFSGPRGVGKTTTARLLAMAVNCERSGETIPCGACESCRLIRSGSHPDVTELDAASNNSVEDIRELREQVRLASLRGGARVWILDEAHMLSRSASNALLKTLEEPPPNLVFVLATTEPEKLLPTILSRCQHFRFRRLTEDEISGKLALLCDEAGVPAAPDALALVARAADGAMRDAESMLERLLASGGAIARGDAEQALGLPPQDRLDRLAEVLVDGDLGDLFEIAGALYRDGFAPRSLAEQLARTLRDALYRRVTGEPGLMLDLRQDDHLRLLHALDDEQERFVRHDDLFALEAALLKARNALFRNVPAEAVARQVAHAGPPERSRSPGGAAAEPTMESREPPDGRTGAPAAVAGGAVQRMRAEDLPPFDPHARTAPATGESSPARPAVAAGAAGAVAGVTRPAEAGSGSSTGSPADAGTTAGAAPPREERNAGASERFSWQRVKALASAQLKAFLMPAQEGVEAEQVVLRYGDTHKFHFQELKKRDDELAALVAQAGGAGYTIVVEGPGDTLRKKP